jgi:hypothetical protein
MEGYATPEEAARGDIPERFVRIVSVDVLNPGIERGSFSKFTPDRPEFWRTATVTASKGTGGAIHSALGTMMSRERLPKCGGGLGWRSSVPRRD